MSGSAIYKFNPVQQTFETDSAMQATASTTLISGRIYFSEESGYYWFDNSILNLGSLDLLMNDIGGIMRGFDMPILGIDESTNLIESITYPYYILAAGQITDTITNNAITFSVSGVQSGYFVEISFASISNISTGLDNSYKISIANNDITVTFLFSGMNNATVTFNYWIFNPISSSMNISFPTNTNSGIILDLITNFNEYDTDADIQDVSSNEAISGALVYSAESGFYNFSPSLTPQNSNSLLANDVGGVYNPVSYPLVYLNNNNTISNLNNPYNNGAILIASGTYSAETQDGLVYLTNITSNYTIELTDYTFITLTNPNASEVTPFVVSMVSYQDTIVPLISFTVGTDQNISFNYRIIRSI